MLLYGDVRRWQAGPLDEAESQLKARSDALVGLADELAAAANLPDWHGRAAAAAAARHGALADRLEHVVAEVNAARAAVALTSDRVVGLRHVVAELDELARVWGLLVDDAGEVSVRVPTHADEAARQLVRAELVERVRLVLSAATDVDEDLNRVLRTIAGGELGDSGATSLAAAVGTGKALGAPTPPVPGPPPPPPTDEGAGRHGVDPWYTRADDYLLRGLVEDMAVLADAAGWNFAAKHLQHYLGNSGDDLRVDPDLMMRDADQFRGQVDRTVANEMRTLAADAAANGTYGVPVQFQTDWRGHYIGPDENKDWYYAMGGVQYAVSGVAVVHPPEHPGGQPRIELDYQTHVFDRYNWDGQKSTDIGPINVTDEQLAELHRAGVAQEYNLSGSTDTKHFDGPVPPPGQRPDLPDPPDDRAGTRTDPGR